MRRIAVLSDTHGLLRNEVLETIESCDLIIHAGDVGTKEVYDTLQALKPSYIVSGNVDSFFNVPYLEVTIDKYRFLIIHNRKEIDKYVDDLDAYDVIIYGHSHISTNQIENNVLFLNPGSCGKKRFRLPLSFLILEISNELKIQKIDL